MYQLIQLRPHREGVALGGSGTGLRAVFKAGNDRHRIFHHIQNLADGIFLGLSAQLIAAAFAANSFKELRIDKLLSDYFQILFGDALPLGDLL